MLDKNGHKDDQEKPDWTLLPIRGIVDIIRVLAFGENKYGRDQWRYVPDARRRYLAAAFRHLAAVVDGQWLDPESRLPHLAHAGCCILFLLWFGERRRSNLEC